MSVHIGVTGWGSISISCCNIGPLLTDDSDARRNVPVDLAILMRNMAGTIPQFHSIWVYCKEYTTLTLILSNSPGFRCLLCSSPSTMVLGADGTRLVEDPRLAFPCGQALLDLRRVVLSDTEAPGRVRDQDLFRVWCAGEMKSAS
jgi:hypothetical protein